MVWLLGMLAAASTWAQPQAPLPVQGETAKEPGTKPVNPAANPAAKPAAKTKSPKPGTAPKAATKPRTASEPAPGTKPKPAPVKRAVKTKPKAPAKKPVAAAGPVASQASPGTPAKLAPRQSETRPRLNPRQAEARYREGVELERRGDMRAALAAYREAGESGHGPAQKKLGDLYGTGNDVVERDYETSLRWYELARKQGIEIRKPFSYPGVRR
jgi:TPR repeat protein